MKKATSQFKRELKKFYSREVKIKKLNEEINHLIFEHKVETNKAFGIATGEIVSVEKMVLAIEKTVTMMYSK